MSAFFVKCAMFVAIVAAVAISAVIEYVCLEDGRD